MKISRRESVQLSVTALAGLSLSALRISEVAAQAPSGLMAIDHSPG